jgi:predicted phage terminase large subunit-like protein
LPAKHDAKQIERLKLLGDVYDAQYAQRPSKPGGNLFKLEWFPRWRNEIPALEWRGVYGDTAQKTKERNDYSVFQCWGRTKSGKAILLDQVRGRFEAPELERVAREFWRKQHRAIRSESAPLRVFKIEDKVSGTGLIQALRRAPLPLPVIPVPRERDKYMRALDVLPHCAAGNVILPADDPEDRPWVADFERELRDFSGDGSGFDDQVDPLMDAIVDILGDSKQILTGSMVGAA